jgi:hypothetical protein
VARKRESDNRIAHGVFTFTLYNRRAINHACRRIGTEVISIRNISTERVGDELAPPREVGYWGRRRSTGIVNLGRGIELKQLLACPRMDAMERPVPLTEKDQISGNEHA